MPDFLSNAKMNQVSRAGTVAPMVFVTPDGIQGNFLCRTCTGNEIPLGVSQAGSTITPNLINALNGGNNPPGASNPANIAGGPGDQIAIYTSGDVAPIRLGTGGIAPGNLVTNDTAGLAVAITAFTANRWMGGVALQAGLAGDIVEIYILPGRA